MAKLLAGTWENSLSGAAMLETHNEPEGIGIRWDLDAFGLDRIQYRIKTRNKLDLYNRLKNDNGKRGGLFPHWGHRPLTGFIINVDDAGAGRVQYDIRGPGACRMQDDYEQTAFDPTTSIYTTLVATLAAHVPIASSVVSNITNNTLAIGGDNPDLPVGTYPDEWIKRLLDKSDSSDNRYDFWLVDEIFDGLDLQLWLPYYKARGGSVSPLWDVWQRDTTDGFRVTRSIENLRTAVTVYYGTLTGYMTSATSNRTVLTDSAAISFINLGANPGDKITNITSGYGGEIKTVSTTTVTTGGLSGAVNGTATGGSATTLVDSGASFVTDGLRVGDFVENRESLTVTGTATGGSTTTCVDTGVDFTTLNLQTGDVLENTSDGCIGIITTIAATTLTCSAGFAGGSSNKFGASDGYRIAFIEGSTARISNVTATTLTHATLTGGRLNTFASGDSYRVYRAFIFGDEYAIRLEVPSANYAATANKSSITYWSKAYAEHHPEMTPAQADQYANMLINEGDAEQVSPFTIGSRVIRKSGGGLYPLWEMIIRGGGYVRLMDLYPAASQLTAALNKLTIFKVTSLDYDHDSGALRVGIDSLDRRLDARLKRQGILGGTFIQRGRPTI